jgi:hypothetical protein
MSSRGWRGSFEEVVVIKVDATMSSRGRSCMRTPVSAVNRDGTDGSRGREGATDGRVPAISRVCAKGTQSLPMR